MAEIVRYFQDKKRENFGCLSINCRYCADRAQSLRSQPQHLAHKSQCSISSKSFTFGGVIAERVKALLLAHRVNP